MLAMTDNQKNTSFDNLTCKNHYLNYSVFSFARKNICFFENSLFSNILNLITLLSILLLQYSDISANKFYDVCDLSWKPKPIKISSNRT